MAVLYLFTSAEVAERIKARAKSINVQLKDVFDASDLNKGTLTNMRNGSMPKADNLGKIAQQLGCSVDYLLGLTDDPNPAGINRPMTDKEKRILDSLNALKGDGVSMATALFIIEAEEEN